MGWIGTIVTGFVVGVVAKLVVPGKSGPAGIIATTILGVAGSFVGSFVGDQLGINATGGFNGFIGSVIGAIILIFVYQIATKKR